MGTNYQVHKSFIAFQYGGPAISIRADLLKAAGQYNCIVDEDPNTIYSITYKEAHRFVNSNRNKASEHNDSIWKGKDTGKISYKLPLYIFDIKEAPMADGKQMSEE